MLRENRVKHALKEGQSVVGTMISEFRDIAVAQVLASAGLDFFIMDMEHGSFSVETVADVAQVGRLAGIMPFMRVPDHAYPWLCRPLDAGVMGLMVPRIETRAQLEAVVRAIKYPPVGKRGCAITARQTEFGSASVQEWLAWANAETLLIVQIEERSAVEDIDNILSVPGVDVALIGPNDLSISMGVPGQVTSDTMQAAIQKVVDAAARNGVASGIHTPNLEQLMGWRDKGMRFLMYANEVRLLRAATEQAVRALRG